MPVVYNDERSQHEEGADDVVKVNGAVSVETVTTTVEGGIIAVKLFRRRMCTVVAEESNFPAK